MTTFENVATLPTIFDHTNVCFFRYDSDNKVVESGSIKINSIVASKDKTMVVQDESNNITLDTKEFFDLVRYGSTVIFDTHGGSTHYFLDTL